MTTDVILLISTLLSLGLALWALKTEVVELAAVRVPVKTQDRGFNNRSLDRANG